MANSPAWINYDQAIALHSRQLRRFGGGIGLRDEGLLRSALERAPNKFHYEQAELPELAAAYAYGLVQNHPFIDGNKRIGFLSMMAFLRKNAVLFSPNPVHATVIMLSLAAGEVSEQSFTRWIRDNWPRGVAFTL